MSGKIVYFIKPVGAVGPIKIGCTSNTVVRLRTIMEFSPAELEIAASVPGSFALERNLHECFAFAHVRSEWFSPVESLLEGISRLKAGLPIEQAFDLSKRTGSIRANNPLFKNRAKSRGVRIDDSPFGRAVAFAGSECALAAMVGVSVHAIWRARKINKPSAKMAVAIERITGGQITKEDLRPDIFGADA